MQLIEFASVIPERDNLRYYVLSMKWFRRWQEYTMVEAVTDNDESKSTTVTRDSIAVDQSMSSSLGPGRSERRGPGPINSM